MRSVSSLVRSCGRSLRAMLSQVNGAPCRANFFARRDIGSIAAGLTDDEIAMFWAGDKGCRQRPGEIGSHRQGSWSPSATVLRPANRP